MNENVFERLSEFVPENKELVIVCIGTDRSTGDSFGPLVGMMMENNPYGVHVYGTLNEPVHAVNFSDINKMVRDRHNDAYVIAIDACLGKFEHVGEVHVFKGSLSPGAGVKKKLGEIGDCSIAGVVNVSGFMEYFVLQNTRLSMVMQMAQTVAEQITRYLYSRFIIRPISEVAASNESEVFA